jgi:hypothetical protein
MNKLVLLFTSIALSFSLSAQDDAYEYDENIYDDINPKHSFSLELGLPVTTSNKAAQSMMMGLINFAPFYQFTLQNHLSFGAGVNYSYFKANEFKVPQKVIGGVHNVGAFVKVGHEQFHSMRFGTTAAIKLGYAQSYFTTDLNRTNNGGPIAIDGIYIEPNVGLVLTAGEFISYSFVVGYAFQGYKFKTSQLGIDAQGGFSGADYKKGTQFMSFGFGFTYYFKQY